MAYWDVLIDSSKVSGAVLGGVVGAAASVCVVLRLVRPSLAHKDSPPVLPYWLPWLGHGLNYLRDARGVVDAAYAKYGSYAPFTLVLGGQIVHVVGNPPDVKAVYRLSKALSFEPITVDFVALFGMTTSKRLRDAFPVDDMAGLHHGASGEANLIQLAHPFFRDELTSRQRLEIISERYMTALEAVMNGVQDRFVRDATRKGDLEKHRQLSVDVPMWRFCREAVFTASVNGMYGPSLLRKHSETFDVYNAFDEEFYKLVMQFPASATADVCKYREQLLDILYDYYSDPEMVEETAGDVVSKWHKIMLERSGMPLREIAAGALSIFWGFNTNSIKTSFWMLTFICSTPGLADRLRAEFAPAFTTPTGMPSHEYLTKECTLLNAVFQETLRIATAPSSMRLVEEDSMVGGYMLRKGERVLLPSMHLHRAKHVWGEDADEFRPERMLELASKTDPTAAGYLRPFGGGSSYCPGRIFSRGEIMTFVAIVLQRYDVELLGPVPVPNTGPPTLGVLDPEMPCNLQARLTTRL